MTSKALAETLVDSDTASLRVKAVVIGEEDLEYHLLDSSAGKYWQITHPLPIEGTTAKTLFTTADTQFE